MTKHGNSSPLSPEEIGELLGAETIEERNVLSLDPLSLAALGARLKDRLKSTGGRPTDARRDTSSL